jgi:hypothetical protein
MSGGESLLRLKRERPKVINDLFIRPDFDNAGIIVTLTPPGKCSKIDYEVIEGTRSIARGSLKVNASPITFEESLPHFKPWSPETPFLYLLKMKLSQGEKTLDWEQTFGMRKIHVQDRRIYFNSKPFYIRGFIRGREAHDHPNLMGVSTTEYYEKNIKMAKAYGFNFIRFHSVMPPREFFEAADRLGILCHVEIRKYFGKYQKERSEDFENDQVLVEENEWKEAILRFRNHPSLMVYCLGNEINNPGKIPRVKYLGNLTKKLDPTRLFLDTCSRGEYDRGTVDIDVQHMSYFAPFGKHYHMFDDTIHLSLYGSVKEKKMTLQGRGNNPSFVMRREIPLKFPLIAHEVGHYNVLRDPYRLEEKFKKYKAGKPWWIKELIKTIKAKGHREQYRKMLEASTRFQYIWIKQGLESVRKSPVLQGFHFLQLSDTERYENANGLLDCFDDEKDIPPEKVLPFNSPTVIVADLPQRTLREKSKIEIPIFISHYSSGKFESGTLTWRLKSKKGKGISLGGSMEDFDLSKRGNRKLCRIEINLPGVDKPEGLVFSAELTSPDKKNKVENEWNLWLFPDRPQRVKPTTATMALEDLKIYRRYPQIEPRGDLEHTEKLLLSDRFNEKVIKHLEEGKDALVIYRPEENRNKRAPREKYYLPSTWERFKGIIWDRGHNCGGFLREHPLVKEFPQDGFLDWQFYNLIEESDKIDLDDFPGGMEPIIEGVDKAVRDRFDVNRFSLSGFQYAYTMRKFAYLFELRVGKGRLVVTGMNFKGLENNVPEVCWMFESIINYMNSRKFKPQKSISPSRFRNYLLKKGKSPRIKERMMTQYWQLDDAPLESKRYRKESEEWLREKE